MYAGYSGLHKTNFNPRSPCGERLYCHVLTGTLNDFNPRSPCGERQLISALSRKSTGFQSTLSLRRATGGHITARGDGGISIHALLAESDDELRSAGKVRALFQSTLSLRRATDTYHGKYQGSRDFNPRSPCGERRPRKSFSYHHICISIHALLAESDYDGDPNEDCYKISIHALLAESDRLKIFSAHCPVPNFNPRSPCGERLSSRSWFIRVIGISIHALLAESDGKRHINLWEIIEFQSTLSLRRATRKPLVWGDDDQFQSTLSLRRATIASLGLIWPSKFQSTLSLRRATTGGRAHVH